MHQPREQDELPPVAMVTVAFLLCWSVTDVSPEE